jgi:hypothetical protein
MEVIFMAARILRLAGQGFYPRRKQMAGFTPERRRTPRQAGLAGRAIADMLDPVAEEAYWRENYTAQSYYESCYVYDDYHPGYRTGWEGRARYEGRSFDQSEPDLEADYNRHRGSSRLSWAKNREAARAAWDRFDVTDHFERSQ